MEEFSLDSVYEAFNTGYISSYLSAAQVTPALETGYAYTEHGVINGNIFDHDDDQADDTLLKDDKMLSMPKHVCPTNPPTLKIKICKALIGHGFLTFSLLLSKPERNLKHLVK